MFIHHKPPWGPKFLSVLLYDNHFWVTDQCWEKCTEWPQKAFTRSRSKVPMFIHMICPFEAQIFIRFILRWAVFKLQPNFRKVPQRTLTCSRSIVPISPPQYTPAIRPKFSPISLYDHPFLSYKRPRGLDALLGHLLVKRIPVTFQLSSTKIPEYLSQK